MMQFSIEMYVAQIKGTIYGDKQNYVMIFVHHLITSTGHNFLL